MAGKVTKKEDRYQVIWAVTLGALHVKVNEFVEKGFAPVGGVSQVELDGNPVIVQAVFLED